MPFGYIQSITITWNFDENNSTYWAFKIWSKYKELARQDYLEDSEHELYP